MFQYHCLNPIANIGLDQFSENYVATDNMKNADAVLVRSAAMHDMEFGSELKAIARAGAGVNNIPLDRCSEEGIVVFNTPGANANGVKELVLAGLFLAARDVVGGIDWVKANKDDPNIAKTAEKAKKAFAAIKDYDDICVELNNGTKHRCILSHFFIPFYNAHRYNAIHLHAHSHTSEEHNIELKFAEWLNKNGYKNEIYNVGCMHWNYEPVTLDEILARSDKNELETSFRTT